MNKNKRKKYYFFIKKYYPKGGYQNDINNNYLNRKIPTISFFLTFLWAQSL